MRTAPRVVDALGTWCPVPIHLVERAARRAAPGEVIELLADDPLIEVDLPAWCHASGHRLLELRRDGSDYVARVAADDAKPRTRASVVAEMEAALAKSYALVQKDPQPRLIFWIDHQAEHYGKLVSNYRMNGIVPPTSRR